MHGGTTADAGWAVAFEGVGFRVVVECVGFGVFRAAVVVPDDVDEPDEGDDTDGADEPDAAGDEADPVDVEFVLFRAWA